MGGGAIGVRLRPPAAQLLALRRVFAIIFPVVPRTLLIALVMLVALPGVAQAAVSDGDEPDRTADPASRPTADPGPVDLGLATGGQHAHRRPRHLGPGRPRPA